MPKILTIEIFIALGRINLLPTLISHYLVLYRCILKNVTAKEPGVLHIGPRVGPGGDNCKEIKNDFADSLKA